MQPTDMRPNCRPTVYLAGPLFSDAERAFNEMVTKRLEAWTDVYLPQRDGGLMGDLMSAGAPAEVAAKQVFARDMDAILRADYLIAILDGRAIDEGVAFELGVAFSHLKPCVGLQTDSRRLASWGNNPMVSGALDVVFETVDDLAAWLGRQMASAGGFRDWMRGDVVVPGRAKPGLCTRAPLGCCPATESGVLITAPGPAM